MEQQAIIIFWLSNYVELLRSGADGLVSLRSFPALLISEYHSGSRGLRVLDNAGN